MLIGRMLDTWHKRNLIDIDSCSTFLSSVGRIDQTSPLLDVATTHAASGGSIFSSQLASPRGILFFFSFSPFQKSKNQFGNVR